MKEIFPVKKKKYIFLTAGFLLLKFKKAFKVPQPTF